MLGRKRYKDLTTAEKLSRNLKGLLLYGAIVLFGIFMFYMENPFISLALIFIGVLGLFIAAISALLNKLKLSKET